MPTVHCLGRSESVVQAHLLMTWSLDAAIVAQVFYEPVPSPPGPPPLASASLAPKRLSTTVAVSTAPRGSTESELMVLEDPFAGTHPAPVPWESSMLKRSASVAGTTATAPINPAASTAIGSGSSGSSVPGDAISGKIADITRALASFGVLLRTDMSFRTRASSLGTLQALELIEGRIHGLASGEEGLLVEGALELLTHPTIHQRPTLMVAMKIIVHAGLTLSGDNLCVDILRDHALRPSLCTGRVDRPLRGRGRATVEACWGARACVYIVRS